MASRSSRHSSEAALRDEDRRLAGYGEEHSRSRTAKPAGGSLCVGATARDRLAARKIESRLRLSLRFPCASQPGFLGSRSARNIHYAIDFTGSGGRDRTGDLRIMIPTTFIDIALEIPSMSYACRKNFQPSNDRSAAASSAPSSPDGNK